ncbi:MAG: hypothetical protein NTX86_01845 [Candidatus Dependentiae bacterium]|nr:hypothetical protein [Candidatus Dependentiae bacterium]
MNLKLCALLSLLAASNVAVTQTPKVAAAPKAAVPGTLAAGSVDQDENKIDPADHAEIKKIAEEGLAALKENCNKLSGDAKTACEKKRKDHSDRFLKTTGTIHEKRKARKAANAAKKAAKK